MSNDALDWNGTAESELEFGRAAFRSGYDEKRAAALASDDLVLLDAFYRRRGERFQGRSAIVEFGCELTRGSDWLACGGPLVITDIIEPELVASFERLKTKSLAADTRLMMLHNQEDIASLPACDLFYAALSVKAIPPTVLAQMLELLLIKVATGGLALLHLPTQHKHYQLMLKNAQDLRDLTVLPQWRLFEILEKLDFALVIVQENRHLSSSDIIYHTVLAQRRA